eukprot:COSAG05_NODE_1992_length_3734_cov_2.706740_2_plen_113_part_00
MSSNSELNSESDQGGVGAFVAEVNTVQMQANARRASHGQNDYLYLQLVQDGTLTLTRTTSIPGLPRLQKSFWKRMKVLKRMKLLFVKVIWNDCCLPYVLDFSLRLNLISIVG